MPEMKLHVGITVSHVQDARLAYTRDGWIFMESVHLVIMQAQPWPKAWEHSLSEKRSYGRAEITGKLIPPIPFLILCNLHFLTLLLLFVTSTPILEM
jgi:hypothetical protein